jgi:hypothetical protein
MEPSQSNPEKPAENDQSPGREPVLPTTWSTTDEQGDWLDPDQLDPALIGDDDWDVFEVDESEEPEPEAGDFSLIDDEPGD